MIGHLQTAHTVFCD